MHFLWLSLSAAVSVQALRPWQPLRELRKQVSSVLPEIDTATTRFSFPAYNLTVPVDHFHNDSLYEPHTNDTFDLRYWFDAQYYEPGGPVLVLAAGETSGVDRLPFLEKGLVAQMAKATHGIAVVLEHRYYGASFPTANLSIESLRFLRTEQALADTAYFAEHVQFAGLDVTPGTKAPWIIYGGSYAGAFAAFARKLYPDVFWGGISSSGVTVAVHDYWQYFEAQRLFAPADCIDITQKVIHFADQILLGSEKASPFDATRQTNQKLLHSEDDPATRILQLKTVFGLANVTYDDDFASLLSLALEDWQMRNWDPEVTSPLFDAYCANVTGPASEKLLYPELAQRAESLRSLLATTSYHDEAETLTTPILNFVGWLHRAHPCPASLSQDDCYSTRDDAFYRRDSLADIWRAWPYQYCTQWGYLITGTGVPAEAGLPLVSRLLDLDYLSTVCREAFHVTSPPDIDSVNRLGGYDFHYPRVAFVDGEADPWRAVTPHAIGREEAENRTSTVEEPFLLIDGQAVHHWDENGLLDSEVTADLPPPPIRKVQAEEIEFVQAWVAEWAKESR